MSSASSINVFMSFFMKPGSKSDCLHTNTPHPPPSINIIYFKIRRRLKGTDGGEDFSRLLDGGDAGPFPLLEELHPGGVVQGGRRVRAEEGGEALAVGQRRGAGAVGQL